MKRLNKPDFIKFLFDITNKLNGEEIKWDVPLCHMDKVEFNYIDILIPDTVAVYDIATLFSTQTIKEKEGVIHTTIDDFIVNFIKSSERDWGYKFHYYSWNVLHVFIDILAYKTFMLRYTPNGLKYSYGDKWINITNNMKLIFDFLDIQFKVIGLGFITDYSIFNFMESSTYFDSSYFTLEEFKKFDTMFECNQHYYQDFLERGIKTEGDKKTSEEQIDMIDEFFNDVRFIEQLNLIMVKEEYSDAKELLEQPKKVMSDRDKYIALAAEKERELLKTRKKIKIDPKREDDDLKLRLED